MGVFDIVLLVSIGFFVVMGLGRGFIKEIKPIIVWIGSLVGAKILAYPVSTYMYTSMGIDGKLKSSIGSIVEKLDYSSLNALRSSIEGSLSNIPYVGSLMKGFTENNWDLTEAFQLGGTKVQDSVATILYNGATPIASDVVEIIAFVVCFILLFIILSIIFSLISGVFSSIKLVGVIDNLLGGVVGLIKGLLFIIFLYSLLFIVFSITGSEYLSVLMESRFFELAVSNFS